VSIVAPAVAKAVAESGAGSFKESTGIDIKGILQSGSQGAAAARSAAEREAAARESLREEQANASTQASRDRITQLQKELADLSQEAKDAREQASKPRARPGEIDGTDFAGNRAFTTFSAAALVAQGQGGGAVAVLRQGLIKQDAMLKKMDAQIVAIEKINKFRSG